MEEIQDSIKDDERTKDKINKLGSKLLILDTCDPQLSFSRATCCVKISESTVLNLQLRGLNVNEDNNTLASLLVPYISFLRCNENMTYTKLPTHELPQWYLEINCETLQHAQVLVLDIMFHNPEKNICVFVSPAVQDFLQKI